MKRSTDSLESTETIYYDSTLSLNSGFQQVSINNKSL
ncbi:unnamed protein product [Paramecium octaurelia]|uniref:Uncharacterized protein n=1 Tax=Paramecium octaurelia TaxID=43137 RepID=A0A8S1SXS9_PAROT|nr:unnamed protein product [Paramecium octaurelia]